MKATAKAPGNIAFIKFWGKKNSALNLPHNGSLSMCLDGIYTITTVEFSDKNTRDEINIDGETKHFEWSRLKAHLDRIRGFAGINQFAKVVSKNNFPNSSGLASSASGFAALSLAGSKAAGLDLGEKELSILARQGSGSASRSIPDGFVEWLKGTSNQTSFAYSMFPPNYWKISAIAVLVTKEKKEVTTTSGHEISTSSQFYKTRIASLPKFIDEMKKAIKNRDIQKFGEMLEMECLNFVSMSLTSNPYILYWEPATLRIIKFCKKLREQGLAAYFTMDAGPQPVIYCPQKDAKKIAKKLRELDGVQQTIISNPTIGSRIINTHLF